MWACCNVYRHDSPNAKELIDTRCGENCPTREEAFADAMRVALVYRFDPWEPRPSSIWDKQIGWMSLQDAGAYIARVNESNEGL